MTEPRPIASASRKDASLRFTLGWAAFLGVSWTWCIGMFLPVLLVRDYGVWGWVVFAIPNVIGAALMGRVLAEPTASERVAWAHRGAGVFFSVVTIAFHFYWVYWVVQGLGGPVALVAVGLLAIGFFFLSSLKRRADLLIAAGVWGVSVMALAAYLGVDHGAVTFSDGPLPRMQLLPLALVCVLGFALCPYLDLTFHRARQATESKAGITAFILGFGGFFLAMILFTLVYAPALVPGRWAIAQRAAGIVLAVHMTLQAAVTIAFHAREVARRWPVPDPHVRAGGLAGVVASLVPLVAGSLVQGGTVTSDEQIYRLFLAFYALVFPTYVWMLMIPPRGVRTAEPTPRDMIPFAIILAAAAPFYWFAFVNGRMNWLFVGMGIVLIGRALGNVAGHRAERIQAERPTSDARS